MTLSQRQRALEVFAEARERPAEARKEYLDGVCGSDSSLRAEVESLLQAEGGAEEFFDGLSARLGVAEFLKQPGNEGGASESGMAIGQYRLKEQIASGGMGTVWLAERTDGIVNRQVALKLPHPKLLGRGFSQRLEREREILASLTHPSIARLYDAGFADDGQPFLALEYIDGVPLDVYCTDNRLAISDRIDLFLKVARAVAYAHAQLVVHRDLKPANILVDRSGEPHLLDFGVAKLLQDSQADDSQLTRMAGRPLTPAYSSPEQIAGGALSTSSDIYSLGVLLFELLTGERPYKLTRTSSGALETAILEAEPRLPSSVAVNARAKKTLRGDIDTIVLKALKKLPSERYQTVNGFIEDLERYRRGQPVLAQPDNRLYRTVKFLRRHRLGVAAAGAVMIAIVTGASVAVWQAVEARAEQRQAEAVKDFIASIFVDTDPYGGSDRALTALDMLLNAEKRLDADVDMAPENRIELMALMTEALSILGGTAAAAELAQRTADEAVANLGAQHELSLRARALYFNVVGPTIDLTVRKDEIEALLQDIRDSADIPPGTLITALIARVDLAYQEGDLQSVENAAQEAYDVAQQHFPRGNRRMLEAATLLAVAYHRSGKVELALSAARDLYEVTFEEMQLDQSHATAIDSTIMYGMALSRAGQFEQGLALISDGVASAVDVYGADNQSTAFFRGHLATHQGMAGLVRESVENYRTALAAIRETLSEDNLAYISGASRYVPAVLATRDVSMATDAAEEYHQLVSRQETIPEVLKDQANAFLALAYAYRGSLASASDYIERVGTLQGAPHGSFVDLQYVAGIVDRLSGECGRALQRQKQSLQALRSGSGGDRHEMHLLTEIGMCELELGELTSAESNLTQAIEYYRANQPHITPRHSDALVSLARAKLSREQPEAALPLLLTAESFWTDFDSSSRWAGMTLNYLAQAYAALGREDDARQAAARANAVLAANRPEPPP